MATSARVADRLTDRLRAEAPFLVPDGATVQRLYHGRHQRSAGAWSWCVDLVGGVQAGSQHTMTECASAAVLEYDHCRHTRDWHVSPGGTSPVRLRGHELTLPA